MSNNSQPNENMNCRQLMSVESFDIDLSNACEGYFLIQNCPPLYISVEGVSQASASFQCNEPDCRFPDNTKFSINLEYLGCYSSSTKIISHLTVLVFGILVSMSLYY